MRLLGVCIATLVLVGCSNGSNYAATQKYKYVIDQDEVHQVERAARHSVHKVDVYWVNKPRKRVLVEEGVNNQP